MKDVDPKRSALMASVKGKNTTPEIAVRRCLHRLGYRFRLHAKELPGSPDIVFRPAKKAILVHGCFWHRHEGCPKTTTPKTRLEFWNEKFNANIDRDSRTKNALSDLGWDALVVWECETKDTAKLQVKLRDFLSQKGQTPTRHPS